MANALIGCWDLGNYGKCSDWLLRNWDTWEEIFGILWRIF